MRIRPTRPAAALALAACLAGGLAACGGGGDDASTGTSADPGSTLVETEVTPGSLAGAIASFEIVAGKPQRVLVGFSTGEGLVLAHGTVTLTFRYGGTGSAPQRPTGDPIEATASFLPVPGQAVPAGTAAEKPELVRPSQALGVYQASGVTFPSAGFWQMHATAETPKGKQESDAWLEVKAASGTPDVGDDAPRTRNPVIGTPDVQPAWLDSRAADQGTGGTVPDEILHRVVIADAIAAGRPLVIVASTPVFCQSRFCGPITDSVEKLAKTYADRVDFVHLEVWQDFTNQKLNPWVEDWIIPSDGGNGGEPWVYLVGRDGKIAGRFDNVASDAELQAAIDALAADRG